jgi:hypothetical protein
VVALLQKSHPLIRQSYPQLCPLPDATNPFEHIWQVDTEAQS